MDNTLFDDCNCNDIPDLDDIAQGNSPDANGNNFPDECEPLQCLDDDCDGDGVIDTQDNCPFVPNPNQDDSDADTHGDLCDNCPSGFNADQGEAIFADTIEARNNDEFCWTPMSDVVWARGDLSEVSKYTLDTSEQELLTTCFEDRDLPFPGGGFYFLVRPDCALGSWQTEIGAEPGRDAALP